MQPIIIRQFLQRYPGPYVVIPGVDGVDLTFDVFCRKTEQHIVSVTYWDDHDWAERVASTVRFALQRIRKRYRLNFLAGRDTQLVDGFMADHPGPFTHEFSPESCTENVWTREQWLVTCQSSKIHPLGIHAPQYDRESEVATAAIAEALNQLRNCT